MAHFRTLMSMSAYKDLSQGTVLTKTINLFPASLWCFRSRAMVWCFFASHALKDDLTQLGKTLLIFHITKLKYLPWSLSCENHSITCLSSLGYLGVKLPIIACFADILRWLNTVSSTYIWMGHYNHSLSLDAAIIRVQRKLILTLALRASCNNHPLARKSFLLARKTFFTCQVFFNICFYFIRRLTCNAIPCLVYADFTLSERLSVCRNLLGT